MMAACYLADPLGSGLLSLKFLVLEAAELSALGRAEGGKGFVFLQVLGALISASREGGGVCGGERGWGRRTKLRDIPLPPMQHRPNYAALPGG